MFLRMVFATLAILGFAGMPGCTFKKAALGTSANPIKLFFTPSVDAKAITNNSIVFKTYLEKHTPYKFEVSIPQSYIAVVEAFGTDRADVAAMNTYGYILAHEKYGAQARLTFLRQGSATYQSQFVARADGPIKTIRDFAGKKIAFVDAASTSGYLLPLKKLKDLGIVPSDIVFAQKHDNVITMIYQGQVDGGATFYSPPANGELLDARRLVKTQYPDVEKKIKIIELSDPIPNDPIIFRKDMPEEMKTTIVDAFLKFVATEEGKKAFFAIYGVDALKKSSDADYEGVRNMLKALGKSAGNLIKK